MEFETSLLQFNIQPSIIIFSKTMSVGDCILNYVMSSLPILFLLFYVCIPTSYTMLV